MVEQTASSNLVAADVGNSRIKLGVFDYVDKLALPEPTEVIDLPIVGRSGQFNTAELDAWCNENISTGSKWLVGSVHRAAGQRLVSAVTDWARRSDLHCPIRLLTYADVRIAIRVDEPARVGIDRLLAAFAADRLRHPDRAAIIVDLGTAITVDLLESDGAFAGGAILPGFAMSARALSEQTDALPQVHLKFLDNAPEPLGKATVPAIESGIYWGTTGAISELIARLSAPLQNRPDVFITGGASAHVAELLADEHTVRHVPNLVLSGIALVNA